MNKRYFLALADYNLWANSIAIEWLHQISDEQWEQTTISSFSSIRQTAIHIASAEKIWIDFWNNVPDPVFLSREFKGTKNDLTEIWKTASAGLKDFIEKYPEEDYLKPVMFKWPRGGEGRMEFVQTLSHVINHSTYHRGQLVNMLRQVGFTQLSSTDQATYYRVIAQREQEHNSLKMLQ
ncbi:DinB family protein [Chitinophaga filiformis]|uniref:DinB family protein n=1 Tax=Chitinophaga filiformis TaxID=104663 RepID=UPI001F257BED|nr:DinB family protein [Chitinophaga filiformis]MCF6407185.1 DinB family protein [Chitinophaga filiformis]